MSTINTIKRDVVAEIVSAVIAHLEQGCLPWRRPWKDGKAPIGGEGVPHIAVSGRAYSGINFLQWSVAPTEQRS